MIHFDDYLFAEEIFHYFFKKLPPFEMDDREIAEQITAQALGLDQ